MLKFRPLAAFGLAPALLLFAACGSSSSESDGPDAKAQDDCVAEATELRDIKMEPVGLPELPSFDMSANQGKTVWVINAARVAFLQKISDGAEAAASAAGMNTKVVYGDGTTASAQAAVEQAIAQKADGIVLIVVDPTSIARAVASAESAGIVVTDMINRSEGEPLPDGVAGTMAVDLKTEMGAAAGWALADSECDSNLLMYSPSALPITAAAATEFESVYTDVCDWCELEIKDLDYGNFASTLTSEVQTDIRRNPDLTHIFAIVGSSVPYVDAGLKGASSDVGVLAHDGIDENLEAIRSGDSSLVADFAFAPSEAIGWQAIDQQGRLMTGDEGAAEVIIPSRLVDASNIGDVEADVWPGFKSYEDAYTGAWTN